MEVEVVMPQLGSEMTKGTVVEWLKKEGDRVNINEALFVVDTEKAVLEVESDYNGVLKKILVNDDSQEIPVGQAIAIIETGD
ncbi:MAG: biotin/lipoyl-containing protein [Dehalococcoidales bacterium]|jgi:pyruvate/2-oxoglutarate dehydrogenase complex dihydrolipoamide acyltransferase (E2) component